MFFRGAILSFCFGYRKKIIHISGMLLKRSYQKMLLQQIMWNKIKYGIIYNMLKKQ